MATGWNSPCCADVTTTALARGPAHPSTIDLDLVPSLCGLFPTSEAYRTVAPSPLLTHTSRTVSPPKWRTTDKPTFATCPATAQTHRHKMSDRRSSRTPPRQLGRRDALGRHPRSAVGHTCREEYYALRLDLADMRKICMLSKPFSLVDGGRCDSDNCTMDKHACAQSLKGFDVC